MEAIEEVKKTITDLGKAFHEFKSSVDEKLKAASESKGKDPLLEEKIQKLNTAMDQLGAHKDRLEKIEIALKRAPTSAPRLLKNRATGEEFEAPADWDEVKKAYNAFLRKGVGGERANGGDEWRHESKTMSVATDSDGGFLVTSDMSGRTIQKIFETSPIRGVASVQTIGTDALEGTYDDDEAAASWVSESGSRPQTANPRIGKWRIPAHELYAMPAATQRLLDDANINVEAWLAGKVADKFSRTENAAFVNGTGNGQPRGFLTYPSGTTLRTQVQQVGSGSSGAFAADKLFDVVYALKAGYRARAQWAMNRTSIGKVRQLKDSQNRYLWEPSLQLGEPARLLGYGINEFNDMPDPASNSLSAAFADWAEFYQIVDRAGLRVLRDPYTTKGFVLFYTTKRTGGDVLNTEAGIIHKLG